MRSCFGNKIKKYIDNICNSNGVTLLELVVAIAILAMVLSPFYGHFIQSVKIENLTKRMIKAEYIAQKLLEDEKESAGVTFKNESNYNDILNNISNLAIGSSYTAPYIEIDGEFVKMVYKNETGIHSPDNDDLYPQPEEIFTCTVTNVGSANTTLKFQLTGTNTSKTFVVPNVSTPSIKLINKVDVGTGVCGDDYELWFSETNAVNWSSNDPANWEKVFEFTHTNNVVNPQGEKDTKIAMLFDCDYAGGVPNGDESIVNLYVATDTPSKVGIENKEFTIYEIDPLDRFELTTNVADNSGVVDIYRGFDENSYAEIIANQQYYWLTINVYTSDDESSQKCLNTLHSSIRKKL